MKDNTLGAYNIADLREMARRRLPKGIFEFVDRGAEDEVSLRNNRAAFERIKLKPRVLVDVSQFGWDDDLAFCEWMVREVGVAAVPGFCFFHEPVNHLIRLHFAKREDTLREAGERLASLPEKVVRRR